MAMQPTMRRVVVAMLVVVGLPIVGLLGYDTMAIRPHLGDIDAILAKADPADMDPPPVVRRLIAATPHWEAHATSAAFFRLHGPMRQSQYTVQGGLWQMLLPLHLDQWQFYGLYASLATDGKVRGLTALSQRMYGKPLIHLTDDEAAHVVAFAQGPYAARLDKRAALLLARARSAH